MCFSIDATEETTDGLGRLVNHGRKKERNCTMKVVDMENKPHLCLFATRDIKEGSELLYDYGITHFPWEVIHVYYVFHSYLMMHTRVLVYSKYKYT